MSSTAHLHPELVIYHANCDDGFCAAWLHWRCSPEFLSGKIGGVLGRTGEYVRASCGDDPPDVKDRDVLIFDFSYPRDVLIRMHEDAESLLVFDHHKTAEKELEGLDFCTFERGKSGARMVLEYLMGDSADNWIVDVVEGRDVSWTREAWNPDVRVANELLLAGLQSYSRDFKVWDTIYKRKAASLGRRGRDILRYHDRLVEKAIANHVWLRIGGHVVPVAASPIRSLTRAIADELAEMDGVPFVAVLFAEPSGWVSYRLYAAAGGVVDVALLARELGGDGLSGEMAYFRAGSPFPVVKRP